MQKYLKYTHAASRGYSLQKQYTLDELKKDMDLEMIKIHFEPINFEWEEPKVEAEKPKLINSSPKEKIEKQ